MSELLHMDFVKRRESSNDHDDIIVNDNGDDIVKMGSFDHCTVSDENSDDDDTIVDREPHTETDLDNVINKKLPSQRLFLTRRLSGMPVLPANSFDSLDIPSKENNIDDDVMIKLNELINAMPNTPSINHAATQNPATITSTAVNAVKAVSLGFLRGFIGGSGKK